MCEGLQMLLTDSRLHCAGMGRMENGQPAGGEMMQCVKVGKLNLVDLAGSERVHITGATGKPPSHYVPEPQQYFASLVRACCSMGG